MKAKQTAPIGADPTGAFLKRLLKKATVLGMKGYRSFGKESIEVYYSYRNRIINISFCWEGGGL
jgi:hypothetical protein